MKPVLHGTGPQSSVFLLWGCRGLERLLEKVLETFFYNAREGFAWFLRLGWLAKRAVAGLRMSGQASGRPHCYADFGWPVCGVVFRVKHEAYCAGGPRWSKSSTRTMVNCLQQGHLSGVHPNASADTSFHSFFSGVSRPIPNDSLMSPSLPRLAVLERIP
jgi:hypothetical protein